MNVAPVQPLTMSARLLLYVTALILAATPLRAAGDTVVFDPQRGIVTASLTLSLLTPLEDGIIRYTTDGSPPRRDHGTIFAEPISIATTTVVRALAYNKAGDISTVATHTYLFPESVASQEAQPEGYVTTMISSRHGPSRPHPFDWAMDPEIVNDTANNGHLADHLMDLPTLSIAMARNEFNHIYKNHRRRGVRYERPASLELIYPGRDCYRSWKGFQINCGIRMQGGGGIDQARKKSFRVLFKREYGAGKLEYPVFESAVHHAQTAAVRFDGLVLRAGGNTNWSKDIAWKHEPSTYLRDTFTRDSQIAVSGAGSRSVFVHLYLNGLYYGLFNVSERPDAKFMASYYGGDDADYHSINHGGTVEGDPDLWERLFSHSTLRALDTPERYAAFREKVAIEEFCDYVLLNWLVGMGDWPWNNWYAGGRTRPEGRIRFFNWDGEYAFWTISGYLQSNPTAWVNPNFHTASSPAPSLWQALVPNKDFLLTFADRVFRHCGNNGPLTDANMRARFQRLADHIENAIVAESARWGDSAWGRESNPHTRKDDFYPNVAAVLDLMEGNAKIFFRELRRAGYYPDLDPPVLPIPGAPVAPGFEITMRHENRSGMIHYTTDGTDPRLTGSAKLAPAARVHDPAVPLKITETTRVKARILVASIFGKREWSALNERLYVMESTGFPLAITELMYHPVDGEELEFIELTNTSSARLDLTGFHFDGIEYCFPPGTMLDGNSIIVLAPNDRPEAFIAAYPGVALFGTYRKHLSNGGERIAINNALGETVFAVKYEDEGAWPESADGDGHSLELVDPQNSPRHASNWRASEAPGGTPGVGIPVEVRSGHREQHEP